MLFSPLLISSLFASPVFSSSLPFPKTSMLFFLLTRDKPVLAMALDRLEQPQNTE